MIAQTGRFEALVAKARSAEPVVMVTPEEREAELRASGRWPEDKPTASPAAPAPEPKPPEPELTPNEQYIAEHCFWRPRTSSLGRHNPNEGRCKTEYDPITGEVIGDGYDDRFK